MGNMISGELKEQSKAVLLMMGLAIVAVLAMIVLNLFTSVVKGLPGLGNGTGSPNLTIQGVLTAFTIAFALFGSFASITALVILVKAIIGIVRGLQ